MAWRDSRRHKTRLFIFISSILLGIASLVAIQSFSESLRQDVENQSKELVGADLVLTINKQIDENTQKFVDSIPALRKASEVGFVSMVFFPKSEGTRLVQVRALEGEFPFYGKLETTPENAKQDFESSRKVMMDRGVMLQFGAQTGDSVRIGQVTFVIVGELLKAPGQAGIGATVAPVAYIPQKHLAKTQLIQKGSRVTYKYYFQFEQGTEVSKIVEKMRPQLKKMGFGNETVEDRQANLGNTLEMLNNFFNLLSFIALLLGCLGVASSIHIYIKEKIPAIAVLRCLGASGSQTFLIFLLQISLMGLVGSVFGALLGAGIQYFLPVIFSQVLPFEATARFSFGSVGQGVLVGVLVSILFGLPPLLAVRRISPLRTLRTSFEEQKASKDWATYVVYLLILSSITSFAWWQMESWVRAISFTLGLGFAFLILAVMAQSLIWAVRRFFPSNWAYVWRQGLSNLYRPHNQTLILIVSIGLGTALISTLFFTQDLLLGKVEFSSTGNRPNMLFFDIQTAQLEGVRKIIANNKMSVIQEVPIITMRLAAIKDRTVEQIKADTATKLPRNLLDWEYRVTYQEKLTESETIQEGVWVGKVSENDSLKVSVEEGFAERMKLKVGDKLVFNVQGTELMTYIGSIRQVEWQRMQTNFMIVFPSGALENAPQFHVVMTRSASTEMASLTQRQMIKTYPNISVIDLALILKTVQEVLDQVSFVIRFMALFSILTGLLVLIGSVYLSKFQRIQESVLLRTLGASGRQIFQIALFEYGFLGILASFAGILLSVGSSWVLALYIFEIEFMPNFLPSLGILLVVTSLTILIGLFNSREVLNKPPLEILRTEA